MLPHKGQSVLVLFTDDEFLRIFQSGTEQRADTRGTRSQYQHRVLRPDLRNPHCPETRSQHIPHKKSLLERDALRNHSQALIRVGNPDILCLSAVNPAAQRPAAVRIGTVIHIASLTEETGPAESLHVDRHPVSRLHLRHFGAHRLHGPHHFMAHCDARHRPGHGSMLNMQIAGTDAGQLHSYNGILSVPKLRLRFFHQAEIPFRHIGICKHDTIPPTFF